MKVKVIASDSTALFEERINKCRLNERALILYEEDAE